MLALQGPESVELVVIATPSNLHYEQAKAAIMAGKHVVVDKPFVQRSNEGMELARLAKSNGVVLSVFQNRRLDGDFQALGKFLSSDSHNPDVETWRIANAKHRVESRRLGEIKSIGDVERIELHFDRFKPSLKGHWKERKVLGVGNLYSIGSHLVDQALCLFGPPIRKEKPRVESQRQAGTSDDFFHLEWVYENSKGKEYRVIITAGLLVPEGGAKYLVKGSRGELVTKGMDPQEDQLVAEMTPADPAYGYGFPDDWSRLSCGMTNGGTEGESDSAIKALRGNYPLFYSNIASAIRHGTELLVQPEEVISTIAVLEDAVQYHVDAVK